MKKLNGTLFNIGITLKSLPRQKPPVAEIALPQHLYISESNLKFFCGKALMAAMILGGAKDVSGEKLTGVTSQKQAIETLKAQGKILPNVPTDYTHYGKFYSNTNTYIYHEWPYSSKWQRFQANNLRDVDGKNIEIQNDIDSCNFLNESVYKANLSRIVPIIIDTQIDTLGAAPGEYERVDRENSWSFLGGTPNKESITVKTGTGINFGTHMNVMADVISAKQDNFTEQDYAGGLDVRSGREEVGVRPGKTRLYINSPASGGNVEISQYEHIYDEAKNNPDKKFILSCSWSGGSPETLDGFTKLGTLDNVIIFVARNTSTLGDNGYPGHASTIEVGYVQAPALTVLDRSTQKINFAGEQNDLVVPNPGKSQTGKMRGDGFCILGEISTSASTAFMTGIAANIWAQNPDWTKDDLLAMLKRDVYKHMPGKLLVTPILSAIDGNIVYGEPYEDSIKYDSNGWNQWFGYGVAQPGKTMKENIFPEIREPKNTKDGKYYFTVSNFPAEYTIQGEGVSKDDNGYYVDLSSLSPGKHTYTFVGKCYYDGEGTAGKWAGTYDFPIDRSITIADPTGSAELAQAQPHVYPNPASSQVFIQGIEPLKTIEVRTLSGQVVCQIVGSGQSMISVPLSGLPQGVYVLFVKTDGETHTYKIVKQ